MDFPAVPPPPTQPNEIRGLWPWAIPVLVSQISQQLTLQMQFEHRGAGGQFILGVDVYRRTLLNPQYGELIARAQGWYQLYSDPDWQTYGHDFNLGTVELGLTLFGCENLNLVAYIYDGTTGQYLGEQWYFNALQVCGGVAG